MRSKIWEYATHQNGKWHFNKPYIKPDVPKSIACDLLDEVGIQILATVDAYCAISTQPVLVNNGTTLLLSGIHPLLEINRRDMSIYVSVVVVGNHTLAVRTYLHDPHMIEFNLEDPGAIAAVADFTKQIMEQVK